MKHYPHHIGDFDQATRHLTRIERSVYRDLLDLYYDTEQPISLDMKWVCRRILARSEEESTAVEQVLNEFFNETSTGWWNERCDTVILEYQANTSQKSLAGKASAAKKAHRKAQVLNGCSTDVQQPLNAVVTAGSGTSTNHEPMNHEPVIPSLSEPAVPNCPHEELIAAYAEKLPTLPQPRLSLWRQGKNAPALKARWAWVMTSKHESGARKGERLATTAAEGIAWFEKFFDYVSKSDFLTGQSGDWTCDLIWLSTASNFEKVLQGNYENRDE